MFEGNMYKKNLYLKKYKYIFKRLEGLESNELSR